MRMIVGQTIPGTEAVWLVIMGIMIGIALGIATCICAFSKCNKRSVFALGSISVAMGILIFLSHFCAHDYKIVKSIESISRHRLISLFAALPVVLGGLGLLFGLRKR